MAAAATDGSLAGLPARARSTDDLIESVLAAEEPSLAVRLRWQGETLGALAAAGPLEGGAFDDEAEELMGSVAASAATAVATAQSVAADRLRREIQASEEARARWARELHDETLQGLVGLRMLLASARRSDSPEYVGRRRLGRARADAARDPEPAQPDRRAAPRRARRARSRRGDRDAVGAERRRSRHRGRDADRAAERRRRRGLRASTETTVYRLVQEALSNAARHSGGSVVRVRWRRTRTRSSSGRRRRAWLRPGLYGWRLRPAGHARAVELAGGWMTIDSSPDGCAVRARLPTHVAQPSAS